MQDSFIITPFDEPMFTSKYPHAQIPQFPFNEYGYYCSELISLKENETVSVQIETSIPICIENSSCDCENGLIILVARHISSGIIRSNAVQVVSCNVDNYDNSWEATVLFTALETGLYQILLMNDSSESTSCKYDIFLVD